MLEIENDERKEAKASVSAETLSKIKPLIADLRSNDGAVRREARRTLVFIGKPAVDLLIPLLKHPEDDVRWEAVKTLAEIADSRAASDLVALLMDRNFGVRWLAAEALITIGRDALKPLLEKLTEHPESSWLRRGALHVLHDLTKRAADLKEGVGPLITSLEGFESEIGCLGQAYIALDKLKGSANNAFLG
jgi:HEAT repeat protein